MRHPTHPPSHLPAVTTQSFLVSEFVAPSYFVQIDLGLRVIATSPGTVSLRTLKFTTYEKSGKAINIRPAFPLNMDVGAGVIVELLRRGTPQNVALSSEIDAVIDWVMAEVTYVDRTGQEGVMTTTTRVRRL